MIRIRESFRSLTGFTRLLLSAEPTSKDVVLLVVGIVAAVASGVPFPVLGILFGQLIDDITSTSCDSVTETSGRYQTAVNEKVLTVVYLGIGNIVLIYVYIVSWNLFGERLAQRTREKYLRTLLQKELAFFDSHSPGEVSSRLNSDINTIQQGTSEKVGIVLNALSFFVTAYTIAFIKDAALGGMLVALCPAFLLMALISGHYVGKYSQIMSTNISSASSVALESLSSMLLVHAFGANTKLEARFSQLLVLAEKAGIRKALMTSIQAGLLYFIAYSANALAYWQGSRQIANSITEGSDQTSVGDIYTVIFILVDATIILSTVAPFVQLFSAATSAFCKLNEDTGENSGHTSPSRTSDSLQLSYSSIDFHNVSFAYPSRRQTTILHNLSISIPTGRHTALVGVSGSGKSTIVNLIMRLYETTQGFIQIGDDHVSDVPCEAWRARLGLVQQEAILFDRSIFENIALGLVGSNKHAHLRPVLSSHSMDAISAQLRGEPAAVPNSQEVASKELFELVQHAASLADADVFIQGLRDGYGTTVGSRGSLLSGGQRQRICLARALVRDPEILVLDEATASLDSASEMKIQSALSRACEGRTTITIAHRLSTVREADNIIVLGAGEVAEQGNHEELTKRGGAYSKMLSLQNRAGHGIPSEAQDSSGKNPSTSLDEKTSAKHGKGSTAIQPENQDREAAIQIDHDLDQKRSSYDVCTTFSPLFRSRLIILAIASIAVIIVGGTYSASATVFGNTIGALSPCHPADNIRSAGQFFALMFFVLAIIEFFANIVSWSGFGYVAEKILYQVRLLSFRALLDQNLQWHESAMRTPSSLLSLLTSDVNLIGSLTGSTIATVISIIVNLLAAIVLTHVLAWKFAIVCLATVPLILGAGTMQLIVLARFAEKHKFAFTKSVGIAVESVESIRLVKAYSLPDEILQTYRHSLRGPMKEVTRRSLYANMWLALAYGLPTFIYALAYWWGTKLIIAGEITQVQFFIVVIALLVSAQLWAQLFTIAPDLTRAVAAAKRVCNLLLINSDRLHSDPVHDVERSPHHDSKKSSQADEKHGARVCFSDVHFSYPARPTIQVINGLNIAIERGQFAALVGPSGAGKSTIIALLERMYRPNNGQISINGRDIAILSASFRDSIAIVPQDSAMFEGSIKFNISLGARTGQHVTDEDIADACRIANVHSDIVRLPNGYDTDCGTAGVSQVSGGQKQRLAIARALIRKPSLLLLDESTSALDAESEQAFRKGLEAARQRYDMTIVAIAHRLTTIKSADVIFMIEGGRVTDHGTHAELMSRCESYKMNARHQGL